MRQFTKKQEQFKWRKYHQEELNNLKSELSSNSLLKYFKLDMPTHIYMLTHIKQGSLQTSPYTFDLALPAAFAMYFVTQLNGLAFRVLKHHYITKRLRELLIANSRFLIYNLLNQLLYYTI